MAQSQNTVREFFHATALAAETTMATFISTASAGEIQILPADGGGTPVDGEEFIIVAKLSTGDVITSDKYKGSEVVRAISKSYTAPVQKQVGVTPTVLTAGTEYVLNIRIPEYGSLSPENFYIKHAQHVIPAGGQTASQVVDALIASLNKNFSKEPGATATSNPLFTFTNNAGELEILAKDQALVLGKKEGRQIDFSVTVDYVSGAAVATIVTDQAANPGVGSGKSVALMEYFYRGNRGDGYRQQHFPYNYDLSTKSEVNPAATFGLVEFTSIRKQEEEFNVSTSRKECTIAVPVVTLPGDNALINAIVDRLELFIPQTIPALAVI